MIMRNRKHFLHWPLYARHTVWLMLTVLLLSCGSATDELADSGGIGGSGVTMGAVSDYGSIFVDGVEFDTRDASIYFEDTLAGTGDAAVREHLPIGQQVVVQGNIASETAGTALTVDAFYRVLGPVATVVRIDDDTYEMSILGQTVFATPETTFSGLTASTIAPDMVLQVCGPVDEYGAVHAGHIALMADDTPYGLKGVVQFLNSGQHTFRINGLTVDFSQVQSAFGDVDEGQPVAVIGSLTGDTLVAASMTRFEAESFDNADVLLMDGFLTASNGQSQWRMGRYTLQFDNLTAFEGLSEEELTAGLRVRVRGRLVNKVVTAEQVNAVARVRLESKVTSVDVSSGAMLLDGLPSIPIHINALTRIHGSASVLSDVLPGDHVRVLAYALDSQQVSARSIFVSPPNTRQERFTLQGPVTSISDSQFAILGFVVDTTAATGVSFQGENGQALSAADLLASLAQGTQVRLTGAWSGMQIVYEEAKIIK